MNTETLDQADVTGITPEGSILQEAPKAKPAQFTIAGNTILLSDLKKALSDAMGEAGRVEQIAIKLGEGQIKKNIRGGGDLLPSITTVNKLAREGKLSDKKERNLAMAKQVKGLNLIVDGLCELGLAKRLAE